MVLPTKTISQVSREECKLNSIYFKEVCQLLKRAALLNQEHLHQTSSEEQDQPQAQVQAPAQDLQDQAQTKIPDLQDPAQTQARAQIPDLQDLSPSTLVTIVIQESQHPTRDQCRLRSRVNKFMEQYADKRFAKRDP